MQITCDGGLTFCIYTGRLFVRVADCWRLNELVYFSSSTPGRWTDHISPPPRHQTTSRSGSDVFVWNIICVHVLLFFPHPNFILFPQMACLLKCFAYRVWLLWRLEVSYPLTRMKVDIRNIMLFFTLDKWQRLLESTLISLLAIS